MSENKLLEMINLYFDGELEKSKEVNLFTLLASDQTSRDYFKQLSIIRNAVDNSAEDFPAELAQYIVYLEKELNVPVSIVSVGPDRKQTIRRMDLVAS